MLRLFLMLFFFFSLSSPVSAVFINEILPHPSDGIDDWIELYKSEPDAIDMSSWRLADSFSDMKILPDGTTFASGASFFRISVSNRLNNEGDIVRLIGASGDVKDEKAYDRDVGINVALGRYPDGGDAWGILSSLTPDAPNAPPVPTPSPSPSPFSSPTPSFHPTPTSSPSLSPSPPSVPASSPTRRLSPTKRVTPTDPFLDSSEFSDSDRAGSRDAQVLGMVTSGTDLQDSSSSSAARNTSPFPLFVIFMVLGAGCMGTAAYMSYREKKRFHPAP